MFLVSILAAISIGGGFVFGVVLVPLHWVCARRSGTPLGSLLWTLLGALLVAEIAWAITYLVGGESMPVIWVVPVLAAVATIVFFYLTTRQERQGGPAS